MKIYLIVKDYYSIEVCAVAETPEKAEKLREFFSTECTPAEIREYNTDTFIDVVNNDYKSYIVTFDSSKVVNSIFESMGLTIDSYNLIAHSRLKEYSYCVHVLAANREHARKIANDLMAEYIKKL